MRSDEDSGYEWVRFAVATDGQGRVKALDELVRALATEKAGHPGRQVSATDADLAEWERRMPHEARMTFEPEPPASAWVPTNHQGDWSDAFLDGAPPECGPVTLEDLHERYASPVSLAGLQRIRRI